MRLRHLGLGHNALGDDGLRSLATALSAGGAPKLGILIVPCNSATPDAQQAIWASMNARGIRGNT